MNILFIYSEKDSFLQDKPVAGPASMQFGISYISSFLKSHGHKTRLLVMTKKTPLTVIDQTINAFSPSLIGFAAVYSEYRFIASLASYIKNKRPKLFLIAGGCHVSLNPETCLSDVFDALCVGEGEAAVLELVNQLEAGEAPSSIANLWIKTPHGIEKNPTRQFVQNLDSLPFPDRQMWEGWMRERRSAWPVLLGRGCPFMCAYCCNHALRNLADGKYVRLRPVENVLREIKEIAEGRPELKRFYLEVETFGVDINWALTLCEALARYNSELPQPLSYGVNLRITPNMHQVEKLFSAMQKANFDFVNIGLESGSEKVRRQVLKRIYSNSDLIRAVDLAKKHKMKVSTYIMVGLPGETVEDFDETIKVTRACLPDYFEIFIFYPYPGTMLFDLVKQKGLFGRSVDEKERSRPTLNLPDFPNDKIVSNYVWFEYNVYKGHRPLTKILPSVIRNKVYSSPILYGVVSRIFSNRFIFNAARKARNMLAKKKF